MTGANHVNRVALEALRIALVHGQGVFQVAARESPIDLIAFDDIGMTLIAAVRSRTPVNDARTALDTHRDRFESLVSTAPEIPCNRAIWFNSRPHGWVWYEATAGGIAHMDDPFSPMIRYSWSGSAIPRGVVHPIRVPEGPESQTGAIATPDQNPVRAGIPPKNQH
mgnify:CR=1 FL=1